MKTQEAINYLLTRAKEYGYTESMIKGIAPDLKYLVEGLEDWDTDTLDVLFEELF